MRTNTLKKRLDTSRSRIRKEFSKLNTICKRLARMQADREMQEEEMCALGSNTGSHTTFTDKLDNAIRLLRHSIDALREKH